MAFHFPLMPRMFMGLRLEDRKPIIEILQQTPEIPEIVPMGMFLRNHDELTLEMVTDIERDYMYDSYARDKTMRLNLGIRRRLAPLLDNDRRRIELMNGMLMSLPGTPIIYYGDEIGMGDNVNLGDRNGVRTPMQWNGGWNAGFSIGRSGESVFAFDSQIRFTVIRRSTSCRRSAVEHSLLSWMKHLIRVRKSTPCVRLGLDRVSVSRESQGAGLYPPIGRGDNLDRQQSLERGAGGGTGSATIQGKIPIEMFGGNLFPRIGDMPYLLTWPYQFYWFRLRRL